MDIFKDFGIKNTRQRAQVISILQKSETPLTAEEIFAKCSDMSLSTVYRTLETLAEKEIISRVSASENDVRHYEIVTREHRHYAICLGCRKKIYLDACPLHNINVDDFTITGHKLEIYGYCSSCKN